MRILHSPAQRMRSFSEYSYGKYKSQAAAAARASPPSPAEVGVVAADGKSRTVTTDGTNAQGQKVHHVAVYDKQ